MRVSTLSRSFRLALLLVALGCVRGMAQPIGPAQQIMLTHADSIIRSDANPDLLEFVGDVRGSQGVVQVRADRVLLYQASNRAVLIGNVHVNQPDVTLQAPRVEYDGALRVASAPVGVTIQDNGATINAGSGRYYLYDRHAEFQNGVRLQDGNSTLRAATGDYYSDERRAFFTGGVRVDNDSGTITARTLTHWRNSQRSYAIGNVVVTATKQSAQLTGDTVDHRPAEGYTMAVGSPKLVQVDTVRAGDSAGTLRRDTTVITALRLEAFRSGREEYVATDSVRMRRQKLEAVAALARFLPRENLIALGPGLPRPAAADTGLDSSRPQGGTPRPDSGGEAVTGPGPDVPRAEGRYPVVWYDKSQLTGDTITVALFQKKLRSIDVEGNGFAVTEGKLPERYDQLAGRRLFFDVLLDTIRQVRSEGGASSIYFAYDADVPNGVNRASGDTIRVGFEQGQALRIKIHGRRTRNEGEYFPEQMVRGQEPLFRLQGFRWIGRSAPVAALNGSLPKAAPVPEVKPPAGDGGAIPAQRLR